MADHVVDRADLEWRTAGAVRRNSHGRGGPVFMAIAISAPLGTLLTAIGTLLYAEGEKPRTRQFRVLVAGLVLATLSMLFPATLGYYPVLFGISGGLILVLFFAVVWYWARTRSRLVGAAKTAADF